MAGASEGIRAVAAEAGVSITTVSHALSGRGHVSAKTRARVIDVANRLGYAPNRMARGLRSSRTGVLGFISEEIATTPYAGKIIVGAQKAAAERGYMLMIINIASDAEEDPQIDALIAQRVDAMIFASKSNRVIEMPRQLDPVRTVLVDAYDPTAAAVSIAPDEVSIGMMASERLLAAGRKRIVHLTVDEDVPARHGRERGYRQVLTDAGLEPTVIRVPGPGDAAAGFAAMDLLLARGAEVDAVFTFNDQMAMGLYQRMLTAPERRIPSDLSVVGVDDLQLITEAIRPKLTTIALPHEEMGRNAVDMAVHMVERPEDPRPGLIRIPGLLIERESVEPAA